MRISILAIGQDKSGPETALAEDYLQRIERLGRSVGITAARSQSFTEAKHPTPAERKEQEGQKLLKAAGNKCKLVVLTERGRQFTSTGFADWIGTELHNATAEVCFLIGGPDGHAKTLEDRADMMLSLGDMTWPHRLARAMVMEQIYRSVTILANHPYHRS